MRMEQCQVLQITLIQKRASRKLEFIFNHWTKSWFTRSLNIRCGIVLSVEAPFTIMVTYYFFDISFWYIFITAYRLNDCRTRRINVALPWNIYFHVVWSIWITNWSLYCNIHVLRWTLKLGLKCLNHYSW